MSASACETCATLQPAGPLDPRLPRLFALATWLRSLDVCVTCALELALVQVGRETRSPTSLCAATPLMTACRDKARARWGEMPIRDAGARVK